MEQYTRDQKVIENQKLVYLAYKQLTKTPLILQNEDDIISEGMIGLIRAADTFDESKGKKFSTYAVKCIHNAMLQYIRKISKYWGKEVSIYEPICKDTDGSTLCYADIIEDETPSNCFEECAKTLIDEKIEQLPEKDREIMQAVIAGYKQKEIAAMMGIRQPTISRRIKKIQYRLRKEISSLSDRL